MDTRAAWAAKLTTARWFGGKGRGASIVEIEPLAWYTAPGVWPAVRSELASIRYDDGAGECYQLLVGYLPATAGTAALGTTELAGLGRVDFFDATEQAEALSALVAALLGGDVPQLRWTLPGRIDAGAEVRRYTGEQSNTTILIGSGTLLKLFRKLEPGRNLDAEALVALSGSGITPECYGVLASPDGRYDLGLFAERVAGVTDGWVHATAACAAGTDFTAEAKALGSELRELHRRLATAFGTEQRSGTAVAAAMRQRFEAAVTQVAELGSYRAAAEVVFGGLGAALLDVQRVHGDFHLGQVLHREADPPWVIIDFEGEPLKSLAERREPDSPWRDVAGLLRSLDYARSAHPEPEGEAARHWADAAQAAFLDGYSPAAPAAAILLAAYEFDKAVYEVVYEVRNRPDWAPIPWRAVQDVARRIAIEPNTKEEH